MHGNKHMTPYLPLTFAMNLNCSQVWFVLGIAIEQSKNIGLV